MDDELVREMIDAARWQIQRADEDEDERLHDDLKRQPIDEVMVHRLVQSAIRKHEQSRSPSVRGRPSKARRDHYIRYWVTALQEQCGLTVVESYTAIGDAIRPSLSAEAIRSIVRSGK